MTEWAKILYKYKGESKPHNTHKMSGMWVPITFSICWEIEASPRIHRQLRFSERPYLKAVGWRAIGEEDPCPALTSTHMHTGACNTYTH